MKYFFIFSIGPVQSFIAQARKAQDLYLGCQMISDYCRHAAMVFQREGGSIVFPEWKSTSLTNRFMGMIEVEEAKAQDLGKTVAYSVKKRFLEEGLVAIRAGLGGFDASQIVGVEEQLATHLETYWVFSPYDEQDYAGSYQKAEQVFGMSKFMRTPAQMSYQNGLSAYHEMGWGAFLGETGRKCVVDGERNVKFYRWSDSDRRTNYANTCQRLLEHKLFLKDFNEVVFIGEEIISDPNTGKSSDKAPTERPSLSGECNSPIKTVPIQDVPPKFIQDGEGLSAVSFFKRCYKPDATILNRRTWEQLRDSLIKLDGYLGKEYWAEKYPENYYQGIEYPTTAKLALYDVINACCGEIAEDDQIMGTNGFVNNFRNLVISTRNARPSNFNSEHPAYREEDEELYFEENITESYFKKHIFDCGKLPSLKTLQQNSQRAFKAEYKGNDFQQYYALVSFDIDGLGKVLQPKGVSEEYHKQLSNSLAGFAKEVSKIVEQEGINEPEKTGLGRVLHAGGDDFMFAINLSRLYTTLNRIKEDASLLLGSLELDGIKINITYSTSIVIAHYKSPLTRAVKTVKAELKTVKDRFKKKEKEGIAMSFMMKSGAVTTTYFKQDKWKLLQTFFEALQAEKVSPKFIFQFAKNMEEMGFGEQVDSNTNTEHLRDYALLELKRLAKRASDKDYQLIDTTNEKQVKALIEEQLLNDTTFDLQNFLQFLKMAELTAKHTNQWIRR